MSLLEYRSPYFSPEVNLEIAIGGIEFRDEVIKNLRQQLLNLRASLEFYGMCESSIDKQQYKHLHP